MYHKVEKYMSIFFYPKYNLNLNILNLNIQKCHKIHKMAGRHHQPTLATNKKQIVPPSNKIESIWKVEFPQKALASSTATQNMQYSVRANLGHYYTNYCWHCGQGKSKKTNRFSNFEAGCFLFPLRRFVQKLWWTGRWPYGRWIKKTVKTTALIGRVQVYVGIYWSSEQKSQLYRWFGFLCLFKHNFRTILHEIWLVDRAMRINGIFLFNKN